MKIGVPAPTPLKLCATILARSVQKECVVVSHIRSRSGKKVFANGSFSQARKIRDGRALRRRSRGDRRRVRLSFASPVISEPSVCRSFAPFAACAARHVRTAPHSDGADGGRRNSSLRVRRSAFERASLTRTFDAAPRTREQLSQQHAALVGRPFGPTLDRPHFRAPDGPRQYARPCLAPLLRSACADLAWPHESRPEIASEPFSNGARRRVHEPSSSTFDSRSR